MADNNKNNTKTTDKKKVKSIAIKLLAAYLVFILVFGAYFGLVGNPLSRLVCQINSDKYIAEHYPDYDIETPLFFDYISGRYGVRLSKDGNNDNDFRVFFNYFGVLDYDEFEWKIENNVWNRMIREYGAVLKEAMDKEEKNFEYEYCFGDILLESTGADMPYLPESELTAGKEYNYCDIGYEYGKMTLTLYDEDVTPLRAAEILLQTKDILNKSNLGFYCVDLWLRHPQQKINGTGRSLRIENFKYEYIHPDNLAERIEQVRTIYE